MATRRDLASVSTLKRRQERLRKIMRRKLQLEALEDRRVFAGPQLVAINPNNGDVFNLAGANVRNISPRELTFRFDDGQVLDPATVNANTFRIIRAGQDGEFGQTFVNVTPGYVSVGEASNEVIVRFQENLPNDLYRIDIIGTGANPLRNQNIPSDPINTGAAFNNGADRSVNFNLDLGLQVIAIVPQPMVKSGSVWTQQRDSIDVFFNDRDHDLSKLTNRNFYQLYFTNDTVQNTDDGAFFLPRATGGVTYDATANKVTLRFDNELHLLSSGPGTFRLRIGTSEAKPAQPVVYTPSGDIGSSFDSANSSLLANLVGTEIISSAIDPQNFVLNFPGSGTEPGHRDVLGVDPHLIGGYDLVDGTPIIYYNFQTPYAFSGGLPQLNELATPGASRERDRIRESLDVWANYIGVKFVETADQGVTFARGDLANAGGVSVPNDGLRAIYDETLNLAMLDTTELDWNYDYGGNWFQASMNMIGQVLGLGVTGDLPIGVMGGEPSLLFNNIPEPVFPSQHDIVHGQFRYRPDSKDIDIYRFTLDSDGVFTAETLAERLAESSSLDTVITIYRQKIVNGVPQRELIARNDDYYSEDSFLRLDLKARDTDGVAFTYFVAVTASGNTNFDPTIADSGIGGTTMGNYELRLNFRPLIAATDTITDAGGVQFDGDNDGVQGGVHNFWFRAVNPSQMLLVDKTAPAGGNGSLSQPYNNVAVALNAALPGYVVRIVGNGVADGDNTTPDTAVPYEFGVNALNQNLPDGRNLNVPQGVTVMVDAGAVLKFRNAFVSVGTSDVDRSRGAFQVLGTPQQRVFFTSYDDAQLGVDTNPSTVTPAAGNWGGIVFANDKDRADQRFDYERQGIFLNYVNHADMRYGGGQVAYGGVTQAIAPIHMIQARPTVSYNRVTLSASSAMSADPDSFEETNFNTVEYQSTVPQSGALRGFTSDYDRVGPDIYHNTIVSNSLNGLFVRINTPAGGSTAELTVAGRWDDYDVVHILQENLVIRGTAGGGIQDLARPPIETITLTPSTQSGSLQAGKSYVYRITYVDQSGNESAPSLATAPVTLTGSQRRVNIGGLPNAGTQFRSRRIYRAEFDLLTQSEATPYTLVAEIAPTGPTFSDVGASAGGTLNINPTTGIRGRLDARLAIDPGVIVKLDGARVETGFGAQFIAEGRDGSEIVFTSLRDNRYGASGTFNQSEPFNANDPADRGDWAGIIARPTSSISLDHVIVAYAGGVSTLGGVFKAFNPLEIHQATARVAHSVFEYNADGQGGNGPINRFGIGFNESAAIFVRGAQPVIVDNIIRNTGSTNGLPAPAISINANSLNHLSVVDWGRSTGPIDRFTQWADNQGPLIRLNRLVNIATLPAEGPMTTNPSQINGMDIRGETLDTESVWDDTDITHVLRETIYVPDFHTYGGLRLESSATQSLVVKLQGATAGFTATGRPLDINDRIGGILTIVGQPSQPVVLTSLRDDSVGAGIGTNGRPNFDTNGDGTLTRAAAGDWRSIRIEQFAHDRNVDVIEEKEGNATQAGELTSLVNSGFSWVPSAFGSNTFFVETSVGGNPVLLRPEQVLIGGNVANQGTLGSLAPGQWAYGDVDGLGFSTVYVRLADGTSPQSKPTNFVQSRANIVGSNSSPQSGELLGQLAPSEYAGDENRRLGFNVHGYINSPSDVDVYSFIAVAGTEVWLDIDRTSNALDTVLELVDANGTVVARSDNSYLEASGQAALFGAGKVMQKVVPFNGEDHYTTNPLDAGMRVVLPGARDTINTYHVRVRSANGSTKGSYQLGVRLRETDEQPGSTVRYADIRYAQNGIEVLGQASHSPLLGEASETTVSNDTLGTAVNLGNFLNTDRAALSIAGALGKANTTFDLADVDFYRFDVVPDSSAGSDWVSVIFDIDTYRQNAVGDLRLWIFDEAGRLILTSDDSNVADDRPIPLTGSNNTDLTQGSIDSTDPYLGNVVLPTGTYYAAVTFAGVAPEEFLNNPLVRLEPVPSVRRIVEERIESQGGGTGDRPGTTVFLDDSSVIPWNLGDMVMFVSEERDNAIDDPNSTRILAINPFTGAVQAVLTTTPNTPFTSFNRDVGDIAFRRDGRLFTFSTDIDDGFRSDAQSGNFLEINTSDGTITFVGDDGIVTYEADPAGLAQNPPVFTPVVGNLSQGNARVGYGVQFNAMVFANYLNAERLYAVGNRGDSTAEGWPANLQNNGVSLKNNILYEFNPQTGQVVIDPNTPTVLPGDRLPNFSGGAATDAVEHGEVLTAPRITVPDPTTPGNNNTTNFVVNDAVTFNVSDGVNTTTFELDAGFEIRQNINLGTNQTIRDGYFFFLDNNLFQFDTGAVVSFNVGGGGLDDGAVVTIGGNGTTRSFEFDRAGTPAPNTPSDPSATVLTYGPGTTAAGLATLLANGINAASGPLGLTAVVAGSRVSLINNAGVNAPNTASLFLPGPGDITVEGGQGDAPILRVIDPTLIADEQQFVIQAGSPLQTYTFTFDRNGNGVTNGIEVDIPVTPAATANSIANAMATAIRSQGLQATVFGDRVLINTVSIDPVVTTNSPGLIQETVFESIPVEETFTNTQIAQAVANTINNSPLGINGGGTYFVGGELDRINFHNMSTVNFSGVQAPIWTQTGSLPGVTAGNVQIQFTGGDTAGQLATRIANAINTTLAGSGITATASPSGDVRLSQGSASVNAPLTTAGQGPGGIVTGLAQVGGTLYAVSDNGGLYIVTPSLPRAVQPQVQTTYVTTSRDDLEGIQFTSLTAAPATVEGGRYANMLFATDTQGRLYAFNTQGQLQPIFANGATSVQVRQDLRDRPDLDVTLGNSGQSSFNGIAFGGLQQNLWQITGNRAPDVGHGMPATYDGNRPGSINNPDIYQGGGSSFYFGNTAQGAFNYNVVGGAQGSLVSREFSLVGYSALDKPKMYFNYFSDRGANDSFRVFITGRSPTSGVGFTTDGEWIQLASPPASTNGGWQQVRIDLDSFAGWDNLRLRFDFSTANEMDVGETWSTGDELRAVDAKFLRDGDTFTLYDPNTFTFRQFEFDLGATLVFPSGGAIVDGEQLTLNNGVNTLQFEFDNNGAVTGGFTAIPFSVADSPNQIATRVAGLLGQLAGPIGSTVTEGSATTNEVQRLTRSTAPFRLSFNGVTTTTLAANASAGAVQAALQALPSIGAGNVTVTNVNVAGVLHYEVTFTNALGLRNVPQLGSSGVTSHINGERLNLQGLIVDPVLTPVVPPGLPGLVTVLQGTTGSPGINETQTVILGGAAATGGSFTLTYNTETSVPISVNASAQSVRAALEGIPGIGVGNVNVVKNAPYNWVITFQGALGGQDVPLLTGVGAYSTSVAIDGELGLSPPLFGGVSTNIPVKINGDMTRISVANAIDAALEITLAAQRLEASNGSSYVDGTSFTLTNASDPQRPVTIRFEYDTGMIIQVPLAGAAAFADGQEFTVNGFRGNVAYSQRFVFDMVTPGANVVPPTNAGDILISVSSTATQSAVANAIAAAINNAANPPFPGVADPDVVALGLAGSVLGGGRVQITGVNAVPDNGTAYTVSTNTTPITLDPLSSVGVSNPTTTQRIFITPSTNFVAAQVAAQIQAAFTTSGTVATVQDATGIVNEVQRVFVQSPGTFRLTFNGQSTQLLPVGASAADVQNALIGLFNIGPADVVVTAGGPAGVYDVEFTGVYANTDVSQLGISGDLGLGVTASLDPNDPRRVTLTRLNIGHAPLTLTSVAAANIRFANVQNISKQYEDLLRIIGWEVFDQGPLGIERLDGQRVYLENDVAGNALPILDDAPPYAIAPAPVGFNGPARFQDNNHEGVYIDDIIIGFAERGELVTYAAADATFVTNPNVAPLPEETVFTYNLEIRRSEDQATPTGFSWLNRFGRILDIPQYNRTIDTNDRMTESYQLTVPAGAYIADGQSFIISDGVTPVRFEFEDVFANNGVTQGSIPISFDSSLSSDVIAQRIREAINSASVQAILNVRAILSDGGFQGFASNSSKINLTSNATVEIQTQSSGLSLTNVNPTANTMRNTLLHPQMTTINNASYVGGVVSSALFQNGNNIGLTHGVVFTTGDATVASSPNSTSKSNGISSGLPDDDLFFTWFINNYDSTSLEFDFQWAGGAPLAYDWVLASEEHNEDSLSAYEDNAAIILDGPNLQRPIVLSLIESGGLIRFPSDVTVASVNQQVNADLYNNNDPNSEGALQTSFGYDGFTDVMRATTEFYAGLVGVDGTPVIDLLGNLAPGEYTIKFAVADAGSPRFPYVADSSGDSALFVKAVTAAPPAPTLEPPRGISGQVFRDFGDANGFRDQGQILIHSNVIRDSSQYGIVADNGDRTPDTAPLAGNLPHVGAVRNLRDANNERLTVGPVIMNNVIARAGQGGINFSGDALTGATNQLSAVPFGRIVNNTIVGSATTPAAGIGINVNQSASPTLLNNIVAGWTTGVQVDATSNTTVLGGMLYQNNTANTVGTGVGDFAITLAAADPLFANAAVDNYYLKDLSKAIDSSVESLNDRNNLVALRAPVGISDSPILAPNYDALGQLRVDDPRVAPPSGLGANVFKDRGAIDRVDTSGPTAILVNPPDNGLGDTNPLATVVNSTATNLTNFTIQIADGVQPADPVAGVGVDDSTVTADQVTLSRDGTLLVLGTDYTFSYDPTNNSIILIPLTGIWVNGSYVIQLDNDADGILDLASNPLKPNQLDQTTTFTINLNTQGSGPGGSTLDFGDAAANYPVSLPNGATHVVVAGLSLGDVVDTEANGQPTPNADGDGADDDGVVFIGGSQIIRGRQGVEFTVRSTGDGILNAWIDFNRDGDWNDPGEQIVTNLPLVNGVTQNRTFDVPVTAALGTTYARFRFSTATGLGPTGPANDGEVEDYALAVVQNPWQNPNAGTNPIFAYDVDGDGIIAPVDALILINQYNTGIGGGPLPVPPTPGFAPPYLDVNGNGSLDPDDVNSVITYLNSRPVGEAPITVRVTSVDVNPTASAAPVEAATSSSVASIASSMAPAPEVDEQDDYGLLPPAAGEAFSPADLDDSDYPSLAISSAAYQQWLLDSSDDDSDDDYDTILGGGDVSAETDDFFAQLGQ